MHRYEAGIAGIPSGRCALLSRSWQALDGGLPNVAVHDLFEHPRDREPNAGTHGRRAWIVDVRHMLKLGSDVLATLTLPPYNNIVVIMIPAHIDLDGSPWPILPPGIHMATLAEVETRFATNPKRRVQFSGFVAALINLRRAGCRRAFLDGSFVSAKPRPGDFDACWDPDGVDPALLDPVLLTFQNNRAAQKAKYHGELFPSSIPADAVGTVFVEFFQVDRFTGSPKGIVSIDLSAEPILQLTVTS